MTLRDIHPLPIFELLPPLGVNKRYRLHISGVMPNGDTAPLGGLTFRIRSAQGLHLLGSTSIHDMFVPKEGGKSIEIGFVGEMVGELVLLIEDISWQHCSDTKQMQTVQIRLQVHTHKPNTEGKNGAQKSKPLSPGSEGAVGSWISWASAPEQSISFGSDPLVMISFSSSDEVWAKKLEQHLKMVLHGRYDAAGKVGAVWSYRDDIRVGDHIHSKVVRAMCAARSAIILLSPEYFSSAYCAKFELPFLLWRSIVHALPIRIIRITHMARPAPIVITDALGGRTAIDLWEYADDRVATPLGKSARDATIRDLGAQTGEIDRRFAAIADELIPSLF